MLVEFILIWVSHQLFIAQMKEIFLTIELMSLNHQNLRSYALLESTDFFQACIRPDIHKLLRENSLVHNVHGNQMFLSSICCNTSAVLHTLSHLQNHVLNSLSGLKKIDFLDWKLVNCIIFCYWKIKTYLIKDLWMFHQMESWIHSWQQQTKLLRKQYKAWNSLLP